jgi:uncharacterized protein (TIGR03435 family)
MTPHFSEDETDDFGAAVAQFRRALDRRVDAHLRAHPHAGVPRVARAAAPRFSTRPWTLGAAVALVIVAIGGAIVWPRGARVYAAGDDGLQVTLADNSRVEMRAHSELTVGRAADGIQIDLKKGDIIVTAVEQRDGHLYVQTKDMTVAVVGTVFLVNAGQDGSRVAVIEGEVRVREGDVETRLRPGEQVATSPTIARRPLTEDIAWSRNANAHLAILDSFKKGIAQTAGTLAPVTTPGQAAALGGQVASTEFEEASIRECDPDNLPPAPAGARGGGANSLQMTPGRMYALCLTPATIIRIAYGYAPANMFGNGGRGLPMRADVVYGLGVEDGRRVRGGPDWVRTQFYTIEAVAGRPADAETMRGPMLRALLERRFGLKAHIETEQIPAFALTVAPGGLKMKEGTCTPADPPPAPGTPTSTADGVRRNLDAARRGATTTGPCGFGGAVNGPNVIFVGAGAGVPLLGGFLGVPVIDRTGVPPTTRFNYVLEFKPDDSTPGPLSRIFDLPQMQIAPDPSAVPLAPNLFTVLEQQFGLRLEPAQAPREFIVIDAVERPAAN